MEAKSELVPSILIVDSDIKFFDSLKEDHHSNRFALKHATTGKEAQSQIATSNEPFYGIFVNPEVSEPSGLSVVRCAFMYRPATPVFMVVNQTAPLELTPKDLKRLGVREVLQKPIGLKNMVELVSPILLHFDPQEALKKIQTNTGTGGSPLDTEFRAEDKTFIPIRAFDFISGTKSFFDVFVKLSSGRYLKLLQAGDAFTAERIETYLKKGITYFYIRSEIQEGYLKYCDYLAAALIHHETAPIEIKTTQTLNQGEETAKFLRSQGVSEAHLGYATKFVQNVNELVTQLDLSQDTAYQNFLANVAAYEHAAGTTLLASLLSLHLEIQMEKPLQIIGLASFFHDIGLYQMPEALWEEDETKMNPDQLKLYHTHPEQGCRILRGLRGVHTTALQAVEQHHMRMGGKGFPSQIHSSKLHRVSEIVGISDVFQKRLQEAVMTGDYMGMLPELERKVFPGFSRQIVYAFRSTFFPLKREN